MKKITKKMTFGEVIHKHPHAAHVFLNYGLHCVGCHVASFETIEQGAIAHGLDKKQITKLIEDLNKVAKKTKSI